MRRFAVLLALFEISCGGGGGGGSKSVTSTGFVTEKASSSDAFVDSIGVNVHLGDQTSAYYLHYQDVAKPGLVNLGVRHIRDGLETYWNSTIFSNMKDLANSGMKFCLIGDGNSPTTFISTLESKLGASNVTDIEGINEPDIYSGADWVTVAKTYQAALYKAVKADPLTSSMVVLAPPFGKDDASTFGALGPYADNGNFHPFMGGRNPETSGWGANGYGSITWNYKYVSDPETGSLPVQSTECGVQNALNTTSDFKPTPVDVSALYVPRMFLYYFNRGIPRSYIYELLDEGTDQTNISDNFGLIYYNNTVKPSYTALKNLISLLSDKGANFSPASLTFKVSGDLDNVNHTLLQKKDGSFYVAIWLGMQDYDPNAKVYQLHSPQSVKITFNRSFTSAALNTPNDSTNFTTTALTDNSITVPVQDKVTLIHLIP